MLNGAQQSSTCIAYRLVAAQWLAFPVRIREGPGYESWFKDRLSSRVFDSFTPANASQCLNLGHDRYFCVIYSDPTTYVIKETNEQTTPITRTSMLKYLL
jgi:hypothetical protein